MSNAEMIATAIVGHIHELHAGMAPLLIQLRLSEAPLDITSKYMRSMIN